MVNGQKKLLVSLNNLLNLNNGLLNRFDWYYSADKLIHEVKESGNEARVVVFDESVSDYRHLVLPLSTLVRNYMA
ncbi:hypothetical protein AB6E94_19130 [Vibrio lentus]|uniref:hypothetical protein n=1 Tax=Vibrio splendidus TaxID=29497 RepID=UPI000C847F10|nr:hypothetical protein [Vibrio splendidus]PMG17816.1 hypothetical protein BCU98_00355 [Vibrio splendidus]